MLVEGSLSVWRSKYGDIVQCCDGQYVCVREAGAHHVPMSPLQCASHCLQVRLKLQPPQPHQRVGWGLASQMLMSCKPESCSYLACHQYYKPMFSYHHAESTFR